MSDPVANPELLRSLGQLMRGLSVLFWGLPAALVVCVQTSQADFLRLFGVLPPVLATGALVYSLLLLGRFRPEETVWIRALERARVLALVNLGLSPFLYWWSRLPSNVFYGAMVELMAVSGLTFLLLLNPLLRRLTAMLPDETLRHETVLFTRLSTALLLLNLAALLLRIGVHHLGRPVRLNPPWSFLVDRASHWGGWFFVLLTVAMTMALIWKTKEAIFHSVFGGSH